ncbi:MAG: hypothetical protein WCO52_06830, partial [bacterium]
MSDLSNFYVFQWAFHGVSGLAEDRYVNTTHWQDSSFGLEDFDNVKDMLVDFYTRVPPNGTNRITDFMSTGAINGDVTLTAYRLSDSKPRQPVYQKELQVSGLSNDDTLPTEVALVMSFQATKESGENQKRRRNRIYLGPLDAQANNDGRPADLLVDTILHSARALMNDATDSVSWTWKIYSPSDD